MKITKLANGLYRVDTGDVLADHRPFVDDCRLDDSTLRTDYASGILHTVPPIRVKLGPVSMARIAAMTDSETIIL